MLAAALPLAAAPALPASRLTLAPARQGWTRSRHSAPGATSRPAPARPGLRPPHGRLAGTQPAGGGEPPALPGSRREGAVTPAPARPPRPALRPPAALPGGGGGGPGRSDVNEAKSLRCGTHSFDADLLGAGDPPVNGTGAAPALKVPGRGGGAVRGRMSHVCWGIPTAAWGEGDLQDQGREGVLGKGFPAVKTWRRGGPNPRENNSQSTGPQAQAGYDLKPERRARASGDRPAPLPKELGLWALSRGVTGAGLPVEGSSRRESRLRPVAGAPSGWTEARQSPHGLPWPSPSTMAICGHLSCLLTSFILFSFATAD